MTVARPPASFLAGQPAATSAASARPASSAWARATLAGAALAAALTACSPSSKPHAEPGGAPVGNVGNTQGTSMPTVRTASDITTHDGQQAVVVGTYDVEDLGKFRVSMTLPDGTVFRTNKAVYIKLGDGTDLRVGARPDAERAQFAGQQVEVEATVLSRPPPPDDPRAAQMSPMPTLIDVTAVRPAS